MMLMTAIMNVLAQDDKAKTVNEESQVGAFFSFEWWQWLLILVLLGLIGLYFYLRKKGQA